MLDEFDRVVGLHYLRAIHLNDSKGKHSFGLIKCLMCFCRPKSENQFIFLLLIACPVPLSMGFTLG